MNQIPEDPLGQTLPGLAIAGRVGGDRRESLIVAELLKPVDGVIAGVVVGEDLGEKDAQGDPRRVDPFPPPMAKVTASRLNESPGEDPEEGEPFGVSPQ
jgi:hypothetical protein